jgi:hypothetical protein
VVGPVRIQFRDPGQLHADELAFLRGGGEFLQIVQIADPAREELHDQQIQASESANAEIAERSYLREPRAKVGWQDISPSLNPVVEPTRSKALLVRDRRDEVTDVRQLRLGVDHVSVIRTALYVATQDERRTSGEHDLRIGWAQGAEACYEHMVFPILVSSLAPGDPINNLNVMGPLAGIGCPLACQIESRGQHVHEGTDGMAGQRGGLLEDSRSSLKSFTAAWVRT